VAFPAGAGVGATGGFTSIACPTQGDCLAVGSYTAGATTDPMIATETANVWAAASSAIPVPTGATQAELAGISCPSAGACVVVGVASTTKKTIFSFVDQQVTGVWQPSVTLPNPTSPKVATPIGPDPYAISCASANSCVVVGVLIGKHHEAAFAQTDDSGSWTPRVFTSLGTFTILQAVDCVSPSFCMASGTLSPTSTGGIAPFSVSLTAGKWSGEVVLPWRFPAPNTNGGFLYGVSCASTTRCVAVGGLLGTSADFAVAYTWSHGVWSAPGLVASPAIHGRPSSAIVEMSSCPTTSKDCEAIGTAIPRAGGDHPFSTVLQPISHGSAPGAPSSIAVTARHGAFDVGWHGPTTYGGSPITSFVVIARSPGEPASSCVTVALGCTVGGIAPHHTYTVDVSARNATGHVGPTARRTAASG